MSLKIDKNLFKTNYGSINSDPTTGTNPVYSSLESSGAAFASSKEITFSATQIPTAPSAFSVFCANFKKAIPGFVAIAIACTVVALLATPGGAIVLAFSATSLLIMICVLRSIYQLDQQTSASG